MQGLDQKQTLLFISLLLEKNEQLNKVIEGMDNYQKRLRHDQQKHLEERDNYIKKWEKSLATEKKLKKQIEELQASNERMKQSLAFVDKEKKEIEK